MGSNLGLTDQSAMDFAVDGARKPEAGLLSRARDEIRISRLAAGFHHTLGVNGRL